MTQPMNPATADTPMPSNLVLDIGNVLCRWDGAALLQSVFADPSEAQRARDALLAHSDWLALDAGTLEETQAAQRAEGRSGIAASRFLDLLAALPPSLTPFTDTHDAVLEAQAAGVPVYILSNMPAGSWRHLSTSYPVFAGCRGVVVSCEAQLIKPDPAIYHHLTDRFALDPASCIFVDDMAENIAAAKACGWQGVHLEAPERGPDVVREISARILA